ncbi:serine palmitoyltransferase 1-like [Octopus vulgaris]|uniref:Serine palmitoyltransferase 1 n=1 Tax=Octopus vulgaris TaxID=6645 RepID=A0AA36F7L1_OCTVU|nr:serine palmitoyltransferase 1-like [Octopus vulgaris]
MQTAQDMSVTDEVMEVQNYIFAPTYHLFFEAILIICIIKLLFSKSYNPEKTILTEKEKSDLIADWVPQPLVPKTREDHPLLDNLRNNVISGKAGKYLTIQGRQCINIATFNFLGMLGEKCVEDAAIGTLFRYGVGSCGPRAFYGTMDVHLDMEDKMRRFLGAESAILYSYGFATVASAIPAYSKRGDVIFCDAGVCFSIQKGLLASRSVIKYFRHNDMDHLTELLIEQEKEEQKNPKKARITRKFVVVEAIYVNHGDICPLPKIIELKYKYKVRVFLEESLSIGVLGRTGRGLSEYYDVSIDDIDFLVATLENSFASAGGFCAGKKYIVDHQQLLNNVKEPAN